MEKWTFYWDNICEIYFLTKYYLLIADEISEECETFLQPVLEYRNAFDHIARVYGYKFQKSSLSNSEAKAYKDMNMRKAVEHTYCAFLDVADFLSYVCRKQIRKHLEGKTLDEVLKQYSDYDKERVFLINLPEKIAAAKRNKDISDNMSDLINKVADYRTILEHLLQVYNDIKRIFA